MTAECTLADIVAARELLEGVTVTTPMEESRWLSALVGGPVSLKCENLQRTGSFKIRGAYLRMSRLSPEERAAGVVAASAGNHAQGVALAAGLLGIKATVFMPGGAPIPKEKATRGYGADVVFEGQTVDDALVRAKSFAEETGAILIHPFDHFDIVTGQGSCGLEIIEQSPGVETVLVPTGGGTRFTLAGPSVSVEVTLSGPVLKMLLQLPVQYDDLSGLPDAVRDRALAQDVLTRQAATPIRSRPRIRVASASGPSGRRGPSSHRTACPKAVARRTTSLASRTVATFLDWVRA